jgi:hypothetical protein
MANENDSSHIYNHFIKVSSSTKQLPMKLDLSVSQKCKMLNATFDSISTKSSFYLSKELIYLKFDELEQFVNDSIMLLVNDKLQQMIIYEGDYLSKVLNQVSPLNQADKQSFQQLANKYVINHNSGKGTQMVFDLTSRSYLPSTNFPKETLYLVYDSITLQPISIKQIKRQLTLIDQAVYHQMQASDEFKNQVFKLDEDEFFALKEVVSIYVYTKLSHSDADKLSFNMNNRIQKNDQLEFVPVINYSNYSILKN